MTLFSEMEKSPLVRRKSVNRKKRNLCKYLLSGCKITFLFFFSFGTLPRYNEKDDRYCEIRENNANPNLLRERVKETENPRLLLHRFFYHYTDSQRHERFAEIDYSFPFGGYCHGCDGDVCFLQINIKKKVKKKKKKKN